MSSSSSSSSSGGVATCTDGVKNGSETGVDCGGPSCPACAVGEACAIDGDCQSLLCEGGTCASGVVDCSSLAGLAPGSVVWTTTVGGGPPGTSWQVDDWGVGSLGDVAYAWSYITPSGLSGAPDAVGVSGISAAGKPLGTRLEDGPVNGTSASGSVAVFGPRHAVLTASISLLSGINVDEWAVSDNVNTEITVLSPPLVTATGNAAGDVFIATPSRGNPGSLQLVNSHGNAVYTKSIASLWTPVSVQLDDTGDAYLQGSDQGYTNPPLDFGCGPVPITGNYSVKLDPTGNCLWSRAGDVWRGGARDYLTGGFMGTLDVGCGPMTSPGQSSYVAAFDPNGVCVWSRIVPGATVTVTVMPSGLPLVTGPFSGTVDAGCGSMNASSGFYLAMLDAGGVCTWSHALEGGSPAAAPFPSGDVLASVSFTGTVDLGGGPLTSVGTEDLAVVRYDGLTGAALWSQAYGGAGAKVTATPAADALGNAFFTVTISGGPVDFGGGPFGPGTGNAVKLNGDGSFRFQQTLLGPAQLDPCGAVISGSTVCEFMCPGQATFQKLAP